MTIIEVVEQVRDLLCSKGRISYRILKLQFQLDAEQLEALKEEILFSHPQVTDEEGRGLVWTEKAEATSTLSSIPPPSQSPRTYTPAHLAERILAEQAAMESRSSADGERKTITATFCI